MDSWEYHDNKKPLFFAPLDFAKSGIFLYSRYYLIEKNYKNLVFAEISDSILRVNNKSSTLATVAFVGPVAYRTNIKCVTSLC